MCAWQPDLGDYALQSGSGENEGLAPPADVAQAQSVVAGPPGDSRRGGQDTAHLYVFTAEKGGMAGCDKELQQKVIYELSQGSKHLEHARRQDAKVDQKIDQMLSALKNASPQQVSASDRQAEQIAMAAEAQRDWSRWCCVVDMDMFFAAVEIRDQPLLKEKPVAVGGLGMISTANYVARRFGVRSAMPGFIAQELCRRQGVELRFVRPDFAKYTVEAQVIRDTIGDYGQYEAHSLDEAYIDITDRVRERAGTDQQGNEADAAMKLVQEMRERIKEKTNGLTASAGIASNFTLAKMAADENKPDGQFFVPRTRDALLAWLQPKPMRKLGGVGKVTEKMLGALGAATIGDVITRRAEVLIAMPGMRSEWLIARALGIAPSTLDVHDDDGTVRRKSISNERTFRDEGNPEVLLQMLRELCTELAASMAEEELVGKTVTIKMKHASFEVVTRAQGCKKWVSSAEDIWEVAQEIFKRELPCTLRLLGVRVSNFQNAAHQMPEDPQQPKLVKFFGKSSAGAASSDTGQERCQAEFQVPDAYLTMQPPQRNKMSAFFGSQSAIKVPCIAIDDDDEASTMRDVARMSHCERSRSRSPAKPPSNPCASSACGNSPNRPSDIRERSRSPATGSVVQLGRSTQNVGHAGPVVAAPTNSSGGRPSDIRERSRSPATGSVVQLGRSTQNVGHAGPVAAAPTNSSGGRRGIMDYLNKHTSSPDVRVDTTASDAWWLPVVVDLC